MKKGILVYKHRWRKEWQHCL